MKWFDRVALLCLLCALAACGAERDPEPVTPAPAAAEAAPPSEVADAAAEATPAPPPPDAPVVPPTDFWLFQEFDWGDSEEVVYESAEYTDGFLCYRHKLREHCAFVKTRVDGEELLARFHFVDDVLYRADILTPDLDEAQSKEHLERVWKILAGYTTRLQGEAPEQASFPDWTAFVPGDIRVTHRWVQPEQEIRIVVARAEGGGTPRWYTAMRVVDPKWAPHEPKFVADAKP
jgi:hypothetical protein